MRVMVMYEDQRTDSSGFAFHDMVCQLVLDSGEFDSTLYDFRKNKLLANPQKSDGKMLRKLKNDTKLILRKHKLVAVFDLDKVRRLLSLASNACRRSICNKIKENCGTDKVDVVLIDQNIESVIKQIQSFGRVDVTPDLFEQALKKKLLSRDAVFARCVYTTTLETRADLLAHMPCVKHLVSRIRDRLLE